MRSIVLIILSLIIVSCQPPTLMVERVTESPDLTGTNADPRLSMVDSADSKWIRKPTSARGIADGDPASAQCTEPGWSYMFYDDGAVIGYEPLPDDNGVMHRAVAIAVELNNRDNPDKLWDYINVGYPPPPPPVTSNDPALAKWQWALCLDDGTIAESYQCETIQEFLNFKSVPPWSTALASSLELYNRDHAQKAHIVWGPEE